MRFPLLRLALTLLALLPVTRPLRAQADTARRGATIAGIVHDSVAGAPLAGASVQLVAAPGQPDFVRTARSDSLGRYAIDGVPDGRYRLGFLHPMLDSLGLEPALREVVVDGRIVRADLATPSPARLRAAICGAAAAADTSSGVVIGTVRDAQTGGALAGATVRGEWLEYAFTTAGITRRLPHRDAQTNGDGWFAICDVPRGAVSLLATRGADSTERVELEVPPHGVLRRALVVGAAQAGGGTLRGTVLAAEGNRPLAGARVAIGGGREARTDASGAWTLGDLPLGTRVIEVRAVGFYPERRVVDVLTQPTSVRVSLNTLKAVLDTVRVMAQRNPGDMLREGFVQRRRAFPGKFMTGEDFLKRASINTSDAFRAIQGVRVERNVDTGDEVISMRSPIGDRCVPLFWIDGLRLPGATAEDLNGMVKPQEIGAVEVYDEGQVPPQFQDAMSACGSIVVWTKRR